MTALVLSLVVGGLLLLLMEIFVIPGFGVVGIMGIGSLLAGTIVAWNYLGPMYGVLTIIGGVGATGLALYFFPRKALTLEAKHDTQAARTELAALVGRIGRSVSPLRPSGNAEIADETVDVITDGQYVDANRKIRVVRVEGARVVVEPLDLDA